MIDFDKIPDDIKQNILDEYNKEHTPDTSKIFTYLVEQKLTRLLEVVEDLY